MEDSFAAAERFLLEEARLLERRLFEAFFSAGDPGAVSAVLLGYLNEDGGFGHALEPNTRCPASLPIYVETAFQAMAAAGTADKAVVGGACDYLARVADKAGTTGAVPPALPVIENYPRAAHWTEWAYEPGLNPTAGLAGLLFALGVEHPWRDRAARWCWEQIEAGMPRGVHSLLEVFVFLEHVPDRERAEAAMARITPHLAGFEGLHLNPETPGYGMSPLQFAPRPGSAWRSAFSDSEIEASLQYLAGSQQPDGGWPLTWEPPSRAAVAEWRGIVTLQAMRTLAAYGRIQPPRWP